MFEAIFAFVLSLQFLVGLVLGAFIGVGLGLRSSTARRYYTDARKRAEELENRLREEYERRYGH